MISETYARPIVGSTEYYNQTANGYNEELFNELVGVRIGTDEKVHMLNMTSHYL